MTAEAEGDFTATQPCCTKMDEASRDTCTLCETAVCGHCRVVVNDAPVCAACGEKLKHSLDAEKVKALNMPLALLGGICGALAGAAVWGAVGIVGNVEVGYLAIGVGWLAAIGVFVASGRKRGTTLQVMGVACAVFGLILGKFVIADYAFVQAIREEGGEVGYFNGEVFALILQHFHEMLTPHDGLWIILALAAAWQVAKPHEVTIASRR